MSTLNPTKKISRRQELRQDKVVTFWAKAWGYYDEHQQKVWGAAAAVVVVILALVGYTYMQGLKQVEAQEEMSAAVYQFEQGNYRVALDGVGDSKGLLTIISEYGSTDAGNLARFYAADALFRLGEYDEALEHFEAYDKGANYLGASVLAGEAAIHEIKENYSRAGDLFQAAAEQFESDVTTPMYLLNAGRAYEKAGAYSDAKRIYETLQEQYPDSEQGRNIGLYLARVEAMAKAGS